MRQTLSNKAKYLYDSRNNLAPETNKHAKHEGGTGCNINLSHDMTPPAPDVAKAAQPQPRQKRPEFVSP